MGPAASRKCKPRNTRGPALLRVTLNAQPASFIPHPTIERLPDRRTKQDDVGGQRCRRCVGEGAGDSSCCANWWDGSFDTDVRAEEAGRDQSGDGVNGDAIEKEQQRERHVETMDLEALRC